MSLSAEAARLSGLGVLSYRANWILGPKEDLIWLIGSVLAAYAIFAMHAVLGWNMLVVWFVWVIVLDTPHFFATYSRTYLDKAEWRQRKRLLVGSFGVFLVLPVVIIVAFTAKKAGFESYAWPWMLFLVYVSLWAYWHVTRQHYGFMRLYHRKNGETGTFDAKLDGIVLYGCLLVPFIALVSRHWGARSRVNMEPFATWPEYTGLAELPFFFSQFDWQQWGVAATIVITAGLIATLVARQVWNVRAGQPLNLPKLLFFAAVLPMHIYMCYTEHMLTTSLLTFTAIITVYHDIQYLAIVWFYNKNRYRGEEKPERKFGFAGKVTKKVWIWMGFAILFGSIPVWGLGCLINRIPVCQYGPPLGGATFLGETTWIVFFVWLTSGLQMHHYVLDQFIWRPGKDSRLRQDLKLDNAR